MVVQDVRESLSGHTHTQLLNCGRWCNALRYNALQMEDSHGVGGRPDEGYA